MEVLNFIQISTDEVYGSLPKGSSKETDSILPNSPYSSSKASADLLCRAYFKTYGLNVKITRCTNNYGPFQFPEKIIPLFVLNLIHGRKLPIYGDGQYSRDWIHVDDHCDGIHKVLKMGASGEIYNIGASNELSNLELTSLILNQFGQDNSMIEFVNDRKGHDYRYSLNWKKISTECGFKPKIDFTSGLADTIKWYQNNSKFWSTRV
jgi:dTDP-glucose 4,6-dehydratase